MIPGVWKCEESHTSEDGDSADCEGSHALAAIKTWGGPTIH